MNGALLAIESSCDETAAAVIAADGRVLSSVVHSQQAHVPFGGVVPELASREHLERIDEIALRAIAEAGLVVDDVGAVAGTYGPGLIGGLLIGLTWAKGFARGKNVPFIGVHHIEGHLMAAAAEIDAPKPPYIGLVVSGGHTALYRFDGVGSAKLLGQTRDDAAGEAFDKTAKLLGLGYPGGAVIDRLAARGDATKIAMPRSLRDRSHFDFSFSGLKTAVRTWVEAYRKQHGHDVEGQDLYDLCASVQSAIVDMLLHKAILACRRQQVHTLVLGGGVAANSQLRKEAAERGADNDIRVFCPPRALCTDNAVMIGLAAHAWRQQGRSSSLTLTADANAAVEAAVAALR
ncbi:MAG TPA: tRNA (adenosine(37)-N6)-threonylcarbamoyltransferase complex transferase subunit TsaD [Myxococcota bacterium]